MGWFDNYYEFFGAASPAEQIANQIARDAALDDLISSTSTTGITDRNQIINPSSILSKYSFGNSVAERRRYNEILNALTTIQSQQQSSYDEWFESPQQQVIREKSAGLNSDILGLNGSESPSSDLRLPSPNEGLPSDADIFSNLASGASSLMNAGASLASLPSIFKRSSLLTTQIEGQNLINDGLQLGNISAFEQLAFKGISDKFATFHAAETAAKRSVDVASWFADDNNFTDILQSYAPSDDLRYQHALNRVRKGSESIIAESYSTNNKKLQNQSNFARNLANPFIDSDTLVMSATLEPLANAMFELEQLVVDFEKKKIDTKTDYMESLDPTSLAESFVESQSYESQIKQQQSIIQAARAFVYDNLKATYQKYPNSPAGEKALSLLMGHYPSSIEQFLIGYLSNLLQKDNINNVLTELNNIGNLDTDSDSVTNEGAFGFHMGRPTK